VQEAQPYKATEMSCLINRTHYTTHFTVVVCTKAEQSHSVSYKPQNLSLFSPYIQYSLSDSLSLVSSHSNSFISHTLFYLFVSHKTHFHPFLHYYPYKPHTSLIKLLLNLTFFLFINKNFVFSLS
jgi:hypothetical protein